MHFRDLPALLNKLVLLGLTDILWKAQLTLAATALQWPLGAFLLSPYVCWITSKSVTEHYVRSTLVCVYLKLEAKVSPILMS